MMNLKFTRYSMDVEVRLENEDEESFQVNTDGFLTTLEELLRKMDFYDTVQVTITKELPPELPVGINDAY